MSQGFFLLLKTALGIQSESLVPNFLCGGAVVCTPEEKDAAAPVLHSTV